jgi:hypothetical protein
MEADLLTNLARDRLPRDAVSNVLTGDRFAASALAGSPDMSSLVSAPTHVGYCRERLQQRRLPRSVVANATLDT